MLAATAAKFPDRTSLIFFGKKISFAELDGLANRFARALTALGVKQGDRVALMLPNVPQMVITYYGTVRTGAVAVPTNPLYLEHELEVQLNDSGATTLVALDMFYPLIKRVMPKSPVKHLLLCNVKDYLPFPLNLLYPFKAMIDRQWVPVKKKPPVHDLETLLRAQSAAPVQDQAQPGDTAIFQYTGGTTGVPKGAVLSHANLIANAVQCRAWLTIKQEGVDVLMAVLPFFHVYGMTTVMNISILIGAGMILVPKFHTKEVLQLTQKYRPTLFPGIQAIYLALADYPKVKNYDLSSVRAAISGAGPLMHEVQERFESLTGARIVEGYGLSEASPVTHANPISGRRKVGSIGLPWPDTEARIVDVETGAVPQPVGAPGELVVRGPQVMKKYWNKPKETEHALRGGWLHTGDIAKMNEEGYFFIVDRIKDMIKTVGENVYPREIEEVLFTHPAVAEAVIVGIPGQEFMGEKIKAYIILKNGQTATAEEIIAFCKERLSKFKVPKEVEFRKAFPKTLVGKVLRRVLRDEELKKQEDQKAGS